MSLIVALKSDGIVYMGADSLTVKRGVKYYLSNPNNYRIFKVKNVDNMLMALDGKLIEQNIAKTANLVPEKVALTNGVNFDFLVTEFVPNLFEEFNDRNILNEKDGKQTCDSNMIVAYKNKIFEIFEDGGLIEIDDYSAIGDGAELALGSLHASKNIDNPVERIMLALKAGVKNKARISYPLIITNTESTRYEVYYEEQGENV